MGWALKSGKRVERVNLLFSQWHGSVNLNQTSPQLLLIFVPTGDPIHGSPTACLVGPFYIGLCNLLQNCLFFLSLIFTQAPCKALIFDSTSARWIARNCSQALKINIIVLKSWAFVSHPFIVIKKIECIQVIWESRLCHQRPKCYQRWE